MTVRKFTPEQDNQLAAEYEAGATYRQLARVHGGTDISVRSAVLRGGGKPRRAQSLCVLPDSQQFEAIASYRSGMSVKRLAAHFGCRSTVITDLLRDHDVVLKPGGRAHPRFRTYEQCVAVVERYTSGDSLQELAKAFNCTAPTIVNAVKRGGGAVRPGGTPKTWTPEVVEWACARYRAGVSQAQIASQLGISQTAVSRKLAEVGIVPATRHARGHNHPSWRGGRVAGPGGYVLVLGTKTDREHCKPTTGNYMLEHRLVMGRALGRRLKRSETVHHINGDKADNRLENLQLRQGQHGQGVVMTCNVCGSHDISATTIAAESGG